MKTLIGGLAAALLATAALGQSTPPPPPGDPMNSPSGKPPAQATTPPAPVAEAPIGPQLVPKNGQWWNGDRKATNSEIAQYKAANPKPPR